MSIFINFQVLEFKGQFDFEVLLYSGQMVFVNQNQINWQWQLIVIIPT